MLTIKLLITVITHPHQQLRQDPQTAKHLSYPLQTKRKRRDNYSFKYMLCRNIDISY